MTRMSLNKISIAAIFAVTVVFSADAQAVRKGESVLKEGIMVIPSEGGRLVGYMDLTVGKYGFLLNCSDYPVLIEPVFESFYNENFHKSDYRIIVKKDGKWGALGCGLEDRAFAKLVVPCIYEEMTPFRDGKSEVVLDGERFHIDTMGRRLYE